MIKVASVSSVSFFYFPWDLITLRGKNSWHGKRGNQSSRTCMALLAQNASLVWGVDGNESVINGAVGKDLTSSTALSYVRHTDTICSQLWA